MFISDLNHIETVEANAIVGGGGYAANFNVSENLDVNKKIYATTYIKGNQAESVALSDASGKNTVTQTFTQTSVGQGYGSSSASASLAATNGSYYKW